MRDSNKARATHSTVELSAVGASVVEHLGGKAEALDDVVDLVDGGRSGLVELHAAERRGLDIGRGDGLFGHVVGGLTAGMGELADLSCD